MSVKEMLDAKGRNVYSINNTASLREAIAVLNEKNIGVVLVTNDNGKLAGILSERDIIRKSLLQESGFRDECVTKSMTSKVLTMPSSSSLGDVMSIMSNSKIRHVPIVDGDDIIGVVSIGDVVKRKIADAEKEAALLRDYISA